MLSTIESPSLKLRRTCEETFRVRAKQKWPPTIAARTEWVAPLESLAREIGLEHTHAGAIVQHVTQYVREIANVKESGTP